MAVFLVCIKPSLMHTISTAYQVTVVIEAHIKNLIVMAIESMTLCESAHQFKTLLMIICSLMGNQA